MAEGFEEISLHPVQRLARIGHDIPPLSSDPT
jgi:hypothetical protein